MPEAISSLRLCASVVQRSFTFTGVALNVRFPQWLFALLLLLLSFPVLGQSNTNTPAVKPVAGLTSTNSVPVSTNRVSSSNTKTNKDERPILERLFNPNPKPKVVKPLPPLQLSPASKRISDEAIANDMRYFAELNARIEKLKTNTTAVAGNAYPLAKAQAWLRLAQAEYQLSDASGIIEYARDEAVSILDGLEGKASSSRKNAFTPPPPVRADLWKQIEGWRSHERFHSAAEPIANLEVELIWAAHENQQHGWRAALDRFQQAEIWAAHSLALLGEKPPLDTPKHESAKPIPSSGGEGEPLAKQHPKTMRALLAQLQSRIAALNSSGVATTNYHLAKAQAWLDFAGAAHHANDSKKVVQAAAGQAEHIIAQLETGASPVQEQAEFPYGKKLRNDLYDVVAKAKADPNFAKVAHLVARLEVQLIWAGHEHKQLGWRAAQPIIGEAEQIAAIMSKTIY